MYSFTFCLYCLYGFLTADTDTELTFASLDVLINFSFYSEHMEGTYLSVCMNTLWLRLKYNYMSVVLHNTIKAHVRKRISQKKRKSPVLMDWCWGQHLSRGERPSVSERHGHEPLQLSSIWAPVAPGLHSKELCQKLEGTHWHARVGAQLLRLRDDRVGMERIHLGERKGLWAKNRGYAARVRGEKKKERNFQSQLTNTQAKGWNK